MGAYFPRRISMTAAMAVALAAVFLSTGTTEAANSITSPDTAGDVGGWTSLALDGSPTHNPVVSYTDFMHGKLKVLHCDDPNCSGDESANISSPDTSGHWVGWYTSLVLDGSGNPVVSYYDGGYGDLRVLHCDDPKCSGDESANITSPDTGGDVGWYTSLALDGSPTHNPVVSYYDSSNKDLKVLHCDDPKCSGDESANISSPDTSGHWVGQFTSLVLDGSGNPVVSYKDVTNGVKVLHCDDPKCSGDESANITSPDTSGGEFWYTSLVLDGSPTHNPVVSYYHRWPNYDLKVLHCDDPKCSGDESANISSPDTGGNVGAYTSLALDGSGYPVVSYWDGTNFDLKVLHCDNPKCAAAAVGGIAELPGLAGASAEEDAARAEGSGWSAGGYAALAGGVAAAAAAIAVGGWYARRRWLQ